MNESLTDLMKEIRARVEALEATLPQRLDPMDVSPCPAGSNSFYRHCGASGHCG
jgi:hypothetical protein